MESNLYIQCPCGNKLYVNYRSPVNDNDNEEIVTCKCGVEFAVEFYRSDDNKGWYWAAKQIAPDDQRGMINAVLWRRGQN